MGTSWQELRRRAEQLGPAAVARAGLPALVFRLLADLQPRPPRRRRCWSRPAAVPRPRPSQRSPGGSARSCTAARPTATRIEALQARERERAGRRAVPRAATAWRSWPGSRRATSAIDFALLGAAPSATHTLREFFALEARLGPGARILIDEAALPGARLALRPCRQGKLLVPYLLASPGLAGGRSPAGGRIDGLGGPRPRRSARGRQLRGSELRRRAGSRSEAGALPADQLTARGHRAPSRGRLSNPRPKCPRLGDTALLVAEAHAVARARGQRGREHPRRGGRQGLAPFSSPWALLGALCTTASDPAGRDPDRAHDRHLHRRVPGARAPLDHSFTSRVRGGVARFRPGLVLGIWLLVLPGPAAAAARLAPAPGARARCSRWDLRSWSSTSATSCRAISAT